MPFLAKIKQNRSTLVEGIEVFVNTLGGNELWGTGKGHVGQTEN